MTETDRNMLLSLARRVINESDNPELIAAAESAIDQVAGWK